MRLGPAIVGVTALVLSRCARSTREFLGAVTVVVSTGGHYVLIERFAITALRAD